MEPRTAQLKSSSDTSPNARREVNPLLKLFAFTQAYVGSTVDSLRRREDGQTMAEYGVVLAVITIAVIGAITLLSDNVRNAIENVAGIMSQIRIISFTSIWPQIRRFFRMIRALRGPSITRISEVRRVRDEHGRIPS